MVIATGISQYLIVISCHEHLIFHSLLLSIVKPAQVGKIILKLTHMKTNSTSFLPNYKTSSPACAASGRAEQVFLGSALSSDDSGVTALKAWAVSRLPEGPTLYPKDMVSEQPERFFVSEIIREKIFLNYQQEIPYCTQVCVWAGCRAWQACSAKHRFLYLVSCMGWQLWLLRLRLQLCMLDTYCFCRLLPTLISTAKAASSDVLIS